MHVRTSARGMCAQVMHALVCMYIILSAHMHAFASKCGNSMHMHFNISYLRMHKQDYI